MVKVVVNNLSSQDLEIMGLVPLADKGQPGGVAELGNDGKVPTAQLPDSDLAELVAANLEATDALTNQINSLPPPPTLSDLGGEPLGTANQAIASHKSELEPHPQYVVEAELDAHINSVSNPHQVTAVQIGAISNSLIGQPLGIAELGTDGKIPNSQLPPAPTLIQLGGEPVGAESRAKTYADQQITNLITRISALENSFPNSHFHLWGYGRAYNGAQLKNFNVVQNNTFELARVASISPSAQWDIVEFDFLLKSGDYKLNIIHDKFTDRGIVSIEIDRIFLANLDCYSSTYTRTTSSFNFTINNSGQHSIRVLAGGKNAASTSYIFACAYMQIAHQNFIP